MRRVFLFLSLLFVLAGALSTTVHAVEYGGLGGIPANPDPKNPRSNSIFIYILKAGDNKQDAVKIINNTSETKTVEVYATDSELASGGSFACTQKSEAQKEVGTWIKFEGSQVTLQANSERVVPFSVNLPDQVSVGEHNGCVVIQEKDKKTEDSGNGVQLSFRSALRTVITVPGDIHKDIEFSGLTVKGESKKYILTAQLQNKGNVSLDTDIKVKVNNLFNRNVYQNGGVYPLLSQKQPVELNFEYPKPFWGGIFSVTGSASYNGDPKVPLGVDSEKDITKYAPSKLLFVMPQPAAAVIELLLLLILIILAWLISRGLRGRKQVASSWQPYTVRKGDTIVALAKRKNVKWKTIARVNKLRAPYELKQGTVIKLPAHKADTKYK